MDLPDMAARVRRAARDTDDELEAMTRDARLTMRASRSVESANGQRLGLSLTLLLAARALGRTMASPSLQDRLTTIVTDAVGADDRALLLDLDFGLHPSARAAAHPYRERVDLTDMRPSPLVDEARDVVAGFLEGRANVPRIEVDGAADEIIVTVHADAMLFSSLAAPLRALVRKVSPRVLLERR